MSGDDPKKPPRSRLRRFGRVAAITVVVLLLLLAAGFLAITEPMDRSPVAGTPAASETEALLAREIEALRARRPERGALRAGFGRAPLAPPLGSPTLGYGARLGKGISRVEDEVFARALAVAAGEGAPLVLLTADLCLWTGNLSDAVARAVAPAVPRERLYFGGTHTHNGPSGFVRAPAFELVMGRYDPAMEERIAAAAAAAVRAALADLRPARLRTILRPVPEFVENRMRPGEALDDEALLLEVEQRGGRKIALASYSAHATAISPLHVVSSGDWPGALCRALEAQGYAGALFLAGPTGQAGPALDGASAHADPALAHRLGAAMAKRLSGLAAEAAEPWLEEAPLALLRSEIRLPAYRVPLFGRMLAPSAAAWALGQDRPRAFVHAARLGDLVLVGHSFEFSAVLTRGLKERLRARGPAAPRLVVTSLNGDHNMYVIPDAYFDDGRYESGSTFFGPHLGSWLEGITERVYGALAEPSQNR